MFNALASYIDGTFEPKNVAIKAGQTIRFVNNSTDDLNLCGTAFTSCTTLKPGQYWQFTFTKAGTWTYDNKLQTTASGSVVVQ